MFRWVLDPVERDAVLANIAMKQSRADYHVIIELSCIYSPEELLAVKRAYQARFKRSMEEDLASHTSGDLGKACNFPNNNKKIQKIIRNFFF